MVRGVAVRCLARLRSGRGGVRAAPARRRWWLLLAALAVCATACRVDTLVDVEVDEVGSGRVTLTVVADAVAAVLVPDLSSGLLLDGVREAGWAVEGPVPRGDGGVEIRASKRFESASQLPVILDEVAGAGVIFSEVELTQDRSFGRTEYGFTAAVNPTPRLEVFSDDALAAVLDGYHFGRPLDEILASGGRAEDSLALVFSLTLLDSDDAFSASVIGSDLAPEIDGSTATWRFSYGQQPTTVGASTVLEDPTPSFWRNVALAAAAVGGLVLLALGVVRVVNVVRTPKGRGRRATRRRKQRAAVRQAEASRPRKRLLRLLVVDVHGVIVRPTDPLEGLLLPVIQAERPDIDPDLVRDRHRKLVLGRVTPEEFWSDLGLGPISHQVETHYLSSFRLVPGLHPFLDSVSSRSLPVAAVGNQPREWGHRLRRMAQLEDSVASWLVSGDVGAALPEPPLFEATRRVMSVDLFDCLYLSSVPEYLDAAAEMGMATAYFAASPADVQETTHTLVRGFDDILRGRSASG